MGNWKSISALSVNNNMASAKIEVEKPTYDRYILDENNIFIPDRYLTRMAHNGLLEKFIDLVAAVNIETEKMNSILFKLKRGHETAYDDVDLKRFQIDNNDEPCNMKTCDTDPSTSALVQYKHNELRDCNSIDLTQAERSTSVLTHHELSGCQPRTLPDKNNGRYAYLPIFPMGSVGVDNCLLLANVPEIRLTPQEMARRQHGAYTSEALRMMNTYKYIDTFSLSEQDAEELTLRLQVGQSIITFNADRLRCICDCNSIYWYFIPLRREEELADNIVYTRGASIGNPDLAYIMATMAITNDRVAQYLNPVPLPPAAYVFSYRQLQRQREFFENIIGSSIHQLPYGLVEFSTGLPHPFNDTHEWVPLDTSDLPTNEFERQWVLEEMTKLFTPYPYTIIPNKNDNQTIQTDVHPSNIGLHVLQPIIHDQHSMLDNLTQNSINATDMANATHHEHSKMDLTFTSWFYLISLCLTCIGVGLMVYVAVSKNGASTFCNFLFTMPAPLTSRFHQQQKRPQQVEQGRIRGEFHDPPKELQPTMTLIPTDLV
ncbi:unnamed protein product [Rotaria sp. Silwood1]|nr:unnamed protein product [Rotaria sp. Silwood1]